MSTQNFEIRVTLYAPEPLPALRLLDRPGIAVCDVVRDAAALPGRVRDMQPHVLYQGLPVSEGILEEIVRLSPAHPPMLAMGYATDREADFYSVEDMAGIWRCPLLARPSFPGRMACAERLLAGLGMSPALKGFAALAEGAALLSAYAPPLPSLQYHLYPQLAQSAHVDAAIIERRMRIAIESAWLHGDMAAQNELMGLSVSAERGKPTNSELLYRLAEKICQLLYTD